MSFEVIHNLRDPDDPQGRTYKEVNLSRSHALPIGSLVEIVPGDLWGQQYAGVRLYVVSHNRDCDGTPLYSLAWDRTDTNRAQPGFANRKWFNGLSEDNLRSVTPPSA
jgi:hypothetical protein